MTLNASAVGNIVSNYTLMFNSLKIIHLELNNKKGSLAVRLPYSIVTRVNVWRQRTANYPILSANSL